MSKISLEDIKRVKALGFLHDKTTEDKFNGRVITRNGKITAAECAAVSQAAEKFGSGEVAMTVRLTMEIQGVPYENIEPLREYLAMYGLETGLLGKGNEPGRGQRRISRRKGQGERLGSRGFLYLFRNRLQRHCRAKPHSSDRGDEKARFVQVVQKLQERQSL